MELSLRDILGDDLLESLESEKHERDDTDIDSFLLAALDSFERDHATSSALYGELPCFYALNTWTLYIEIQKVNLNPVTDQSHCTNEH